jgi:hypothetical protein
VGGPELAAHHVSERSIRQNVKLRNFCRIEGEYYVIPQSTGSAEIGAVVAMGETADAAIAEVKRLAELIEGHLLDKPVDALDQAREQLEKVLGPDKPKSKARSAPTSCWPRAPSRTTQYQKRIAQQA